MQNMLNEVLNQLRRNHFSLPEDDGKSVFALITRAQKDILLLFKNNDYARVPKVSDRLRVETYSRLPPYPADDAAELFSALAQVFVEGSVRWSSPNLFYNVGSPVCDAALAGYHLGLSANLYQINDGLAGNAIQAEKAVAAILAGLAGVDVRQSHGIFSFGGTATNLYAMKIGTRKAFPKSGETGFEGNRMKIAVTEDSHFCHVSNVDWLGIGTDNIVIIKANSNRDSCLADAEEKISCVLEQGFALPCIVINGGTTYDHAIDDIRAFAALRDRVVDRFHLSYRPHLHVDSVIGWAWLMFRTYDFDLNPLGIDSETLLHIKMKTDRISEVKYADSWGVDFHKGVGSSPVDCSMFFANSALDLQRLSKSKNVLTDMHQLASEFSAENPTDFTLETSRAAAKSLSALAALHTLGQAGYQSLLANLVQNTLLMRRLIWENAPERMLIMNKGDVGYVTMIRILPPDVTASTSLDAEDRSLTNYINWYMKALYVWDEKTRMSAAMPTFVYSYTSKYLKTERGADVSAVKFYPTSPYLDAKHVREGFRVLLEQKVYFDTEFWPSIKPQYVAA